MKVFHKTPVFFERWLPLLWSSVSNVLVIVFVFVIVLLMSFCWSGHLSSLLWSNVSKVTSVLGYSLTINGLSCIIYFIPQNICNYGPCMCYIFGKHWVQGCQKWCSQVSDMQTCAWPYPLWLVSCIDPSVSLNLRATLDMVWYSMVLYGILWYRSML